MLWRMSAKIAGGAKTRNRAVIRCSWCLLEGGGRAAGRVLPWFRESFGGGEKKQQEKCLLLLPATNVSSMSGIIFTLHSNALMWKCPMVQERRKVLQEALGKDRNDFKSICTCTSPELPTSKNKKGWSFLSTACACRRHWWWYRQQRRIKAS